jgi:exodeoxyribonuclease VII small subunit
MAKTPTPDDAPIPYEQARDELIAVVQKLETGGTSLEEALALWERGEQLAGICQRWLDGARERLAKASGQDADQDADSEEM